MTAADSSNVRSDGSTRDGSTSAPWAYVNLDIRSETNDYVGIAWAEDGAPALKAALANARRIVASVNALADLPIEALETMAAQKLAALRAGEAQE